MPRPALRALAGWAAGIAFAAAAAAVNPHFDDNRVEGGCAACHRGHGASRSPMLPAPQAEVCLSCHGSQAAANRKVAAGKMSEAANPKLLSATLSLPFTHPITAEAYSRLEPDVVTCTSCHSPHRDIPRSVAAADGSRGRRKLSTRDPNEFEVDLCQRCHGSAGLSTQSPTDLSRLTHPSNRSYHPLEAPAAGSSPSVAKELAGKEINCSDCHGNSVEGEPSGPHGSEVAYILKDTYTTVDGEEESEEAYALCYGCHGRDAVLSSPLFPLHALHVVREQTSCATCHDAHGSVGNRALIRFGEETDLAGAAESIAGGRLAFESAAAGSGSCYVSCHGVDHAPASYGGLEELFADSPAGPLRAKPLLAAPEAAPRPQPGPRPRRQPREPPPPRR